MDFLSHVVAESARFRTALSTAAPTSRVPTCPDWDASDLLWHLSGVQHFWATIVVDRLTDRPDVTVPNRSDTDPFEFFDEAHERLTTALRQAHDDERVWTWAADAQHVGFVRRRQAHEALIHRLDAELTAGLRTPLDPALAADGIAEALQHMFGGLPDWATIDELGPVGQLTTQDTHDTWTLRMVLWSGISPNTGTRYDREGGLLEVDADDPAFTIFGTAEDLDAWLWSRPTVESLERTGDTSAIDDLVAGGVA